MKKFHDITSNNETERRPMLVGHFLDCDIDVKNEVKEEALDDDSLDEDTESVDNLNVSEEPTYLSIQQESDNQPAVRVDPVSFLQPQEEEVFRNFFRLLCF